MKLMALKVYFFLATSCPISQQYTTYINQFSNRYADKHIEVLLVFPHKKNKVKEEVMHFIKKYGLSAPFIIDRKYSLSKKLDARVTPEVFLMSENNAILYHGAIDNWFYALGQNRMNITEHYLDDAIAQALHHQPILTPFVKPVGCFIETGPPNR